jgi:putative ABC transport system ATP-binding protein
LLEPANTPMDALDLPRPDPERAGAHGDSTILISELVFSWAGARKSLLDIESLRVAQAERIFLFGPSGSGKSTLLSLIGGLLVPQSGTVRILDRDIAAMDAAARDHFRADHVGFIFQMFNLIPYLSVVENVCLPCRFSPLRRQRAQRTAGSVQAEARRLLEHLDMGGTEILRRPVTGLSVGQQQRVAAARALIGAPELIIGDEPTSSLDADRRGAFLDLLFRECAREQSALVFVSHDASIASRFDRVIRLADINRAHGGSDAQ